MKYFIQNADGDYWEHDFGWTSAWENATCYSEEEHDAFNLPIGGKWVEAE